MFKAPLQSSLVLTATVPTPTIATEIAVVAFTVASITLFKPFNPVLAIDDNLEVTPNLSFKSPSFSDNPFIFFVASFALSLKPPKESLASFVAFLRFIFFATSPKASSNSSALSFTLSKSEAISEVSAATSLAAPEKVLFISASVELSFFIEFCKLFNSLAISFKPFSVIPFISLMPFFTPLESSFVSIITLNHHS